MGKDQRSGIFSQHIVILCGLMLLTYLHILRSAQNLVLVLFRLGAEINCDLVICQKVPEIIDVTHRFHLK